MKFRRYKWIIKPLLPRFYALKHRWKFWWFEENHNISWGKSTIIAGRANLSARSPGKINIGENCHIADYVQLLAKGGQIEIGNRVSVNHYSMLHGEGGLKIGNNVAIACHVMIIPANHVFQDPDRLIKDQGMVKQGIIIEDDVWIASNVAILDGVTIGQGSVIAANSVVNKSVPPYSVVGGVPARILKSRKAPELLAEVVNE